MYVHIGRCTCTYTVSVHTYIGSMRRMRGSRENGATSIVVVPLDHIRVRVNTEEKRRPTRQRGAHHMGSTGAGIESKEYNSTPFASEKQKKKRYLPITY